MSMFTRKMKMLTAIVLDSRSDMVVKALLELGVMDFIHLSNNDKLKKHEDVANSELVELKSRIEAFYNQGGIVYPVLEDKDVEVLDEKLDLAECRRVLDNLSSSLLSLKDKQQKFTQKGIIIDEMISYFDKKKFDYIDLRVGTISRSSYDSFKNRLTPLGAITFEQGTDLVVVSLKRDSSRTNEVLDKFGWSESSALQDQKAATEEAYKELTSIKAEIGKERDGIFNDIRVKIQEKKETLDSLYVKIRLNELSSHMESYFSYTDHTTLFSGWIPEDSMAMVENAIKKATDNVCIIEWTGDSEVERDKIPVSMSSPRFLKPFEHIVENYKTPEYGSINPVPFTTVAFMLMFALMFADVGQGLILLLIGIIGKQIYKKNPLKKDGLISRYLCSLLIYLGPASMFGGLLFGSYFGYSLFPALWFNYHQVVTGHATEGLVTDIFGILGITIKFGIVVIYTGLILNWINLINKRRFMELIFDKNGLVGGFLYGVGIYLGFGFVKSGYKTLPLTNTALALIILGLVILVIKGPAYTIYNKKHGKESEGVGQIIIDCVMDFLLDCLEIFSGFLSNTLSFMRIAGLGIAHVSLMVAFEDMATLTGNIIFEILIMILGNILVIALEGLSAGIQSLRLNYYEFFTKYFTGSGISYSPIGLNSRIQLKR